MQEYVIATAVWSDESISTCLVELHNPTSNRHTNQLQPTTE